MNLKCPNLLTIFDMKTSDSGDTFVVMEYVAGPSLASVLRQYPSGLPLAEVRHWLKGLVEGVAYLHDHGIVHRDLKPANLFMEEGIVKIGDYGLAKLITPSQGTEHSESIGTCHYMAPEIGSGKYHKPIDVYAMGVILYEMLTGRVPFEGETVNEVLMKHLTARPDVSKLPQPYQTIVAKALAKDPNHRISRVFDLLPPEDAPRAPEVRIIGDGKASPTVAAPRPGMGPLAGRLRTTSCGSRPRSRSSTSVRTLALLELQGRNRDRRADSGQLGGSAASSQATSLHRLPAAESGGTSRRLLPRAMVRFARRRMLDRPSKQPTRRVAAPPPEPPPLASGRVRTAELAGLDALGRAARGALDRPRRRTPGHRSIERSSATGFSLRYGAPGHVDDPGSQ